MADPQVALRMRLESVGVRVGYGQRRLLFVLRREGWPVSQKRVYWLYRSEDLALRMKVPRRKVACLTREEPPTAKEMLEYGFCF